MNQAWVLMLEAADASFDGDYFNGPSLMRTLESLTPDMAAYAATHEGYSAWEVAHHVAYFKHHVTKAIDPSVEPYPLRKGPSGFAPPSEVSETAWSEVLSYHRVIHAKAMSALRAAPDSIFDEPMPKWGTTIGRTIVWLLSHDSYHCAQLRNMGVPGLKEPK